MSEIRSRLAPGVLQALKPPVSARPAEKSGEVKLTLKELAKAAEISERTIRYYIQEGVLPPPLGAGPASYYGLKHLTRLSLVRRLKATLLSLSQIKQLLSELTPDELEQIADQFYDELAHTNPVVQGRARLERARPALAKTGPGAGSALPLQEELEVFHPPEEQMLAHEGSTPLESLNFAGRWNRIALAPGLELHYQEGGPQDSGEGRERLARLVELALRLYS
jgi:DNA-binding transcriptional MerR regulator